MPSRPSSAQSKGNKLNNSQQLQGGTQNPMEIETGMVFALETYCPATDGVSAARIEEEVVVTATGCQVISLFPAEELPIANRY